MSAMNGRGRWMRGARRIAAAGCAAFLAASTLPALAWQDFRELRISGAEITEVTLRDPEPEDPFVLVLDLVHGETIEIESDMELERCAEDARLAIGNRDAILEIRVWTNALSMNGVMVVGCAVTNGLFPLE